MKAIYKITNLKNGKIYVGQSVDPQKRWIAHKSRARNMKDVEASALYSAIHKYGEDNFSFEVIEWREDYSEAEKEWIKKLNTVSPNGYNLTEGGEEPPHKFGEEHHNSIYKQGIIDNIIDDLLSKKYTQSQIQKKYSVTQHLVTSINRGVTHRRKDINYPILAESLYHNSKDSLDAIRYLLANSTCTCAEIGAYFNFSTSTIKHINTGKNYFNPDIKYPIRTFRGKANSQSVETILAKRSTVTIDT